MVESGRSLPRRSLFGSVGLTVGAGLAANLLPATATLASAAGASELRSADYWATKGEVKLYLYRKWLGAPEPGEPPRSVLLLVHGSSASGRPTFDLAVPGRGDYSVMNAFARWGFDVWTLDHEGYGRSSRTAGNSDIASGVEDLAAATAVILRETGAAKLDLFGESSGALRAGAFAMAHPERVDRLVFSALTYKGEGSPTLGKRAEQLAFYQTHNRRPRGRDMLLSIFTRDKAGTSDPAVGEAFANAELVYGEDVPTGTYLDMTSKLPVVDPKKIFAPVMVIRGEYDGIATVDDLVQFFDQLPSGDRQFVILPGTAHSVVLGLNRQLFWHAMRAFLTMPAPTNA